MKRKKKRGRPAPRPRRSFELLWQPGVRRRRGPVAGMGRADLVRAAIGIADREGLAAVTMSRVAGELGVTTMALYRHVPGKGELVDLMTDAAFVNAPLSTGADWRGEIARWARADLALFQRHAWLHEAVMHGTAAGPHWLDWVESALRALSGAPVAPHEKFSVILLIDGHARASAQVTSGAKMSGEWAANFGRVLARSMSDPRYRALAELASGGSFAPAFEGEHSAFEFGLARLLDGLAATPVARAAT